MKITLSMPDTITVRLCEDIITAPPRGGQQWADVCNAKLWAANEIMYIYRSYGISSVHIAGSIGAAIDRAL